jgi:hypothetical protein
MIDEDGIGGAIVDGMFGARGFVANSSALPTANEIRGRFSKIDTKFTPKNNFANLKAQCAFKLAELINEHAVAFKVPEYRDVIIEELTALLRQKDIDSERKLQIIPKDEVKRSLGRSPDVGDTIIYRAWFELKKEALEEDPNRGNVIEKQNTQFMVNRANKVMGSNK